MNKKTDYVIDSKSSDEQQQFMAIVPKDGITHSKTEEQKPEPQDIKNSTICPSPGDNNRRNKVSKSQNFKKPNILSSNLDQTGKDIRPKGQKVKKSSNKSNSDKENYVPVSRIEVDHPKFASNPENLSDNSSISDWEDLYDENCSENPDDLDNFDTVHPIYQNYYGGVYSEQIPTYSSRNLIHKKQVIPDYKYVYECSQNEDMDNPSNSKRKYKTKKTIFTKK